MFAAAAIHVGTASTWMGEKERTESGAYIEAGGHRINHVVLASIQDASRATGISFGYLMAQAGRESAFRSDAGSRLSSAAGLYQFTAPTWIMLVKEHGAAHGLGEYADKIRRGDDGRLTAPPAVRSRILELRRDARLSALMAGEYAKDNRSFLEHRLGRRINTTDLYFAHFLGPYGALRFLKARAEDPAQPAIDVVTAAAARNNAQIFYERRKARSVAAVYDRVRHHIDRPIEAYAHLEEARAWAAAWTETIETGTNRLVGAVPAPGRKPGLAQMIQLAELEPPPAPTAKDFGRSARQELDADVAALVAALPDELPPAPQLAALELDHIAVSAARIRGQMPPPAGAVVPAAAGTGPLRWLFGSLRTLLGESA
jgi:hypothetical protein